MVTDEVAAKSTRPRMKTMFPNGSTRLPPKMSIALPIRGPKKAGNRKAMENAQKKVQVRMPSDWDIGTARIAGR